MDYKKEVKMRIKRLLIPAIAMLFLLYPILAVALEKQTFTIGQAVTEVLTKNPQVFEAENLVKSAAEAVTIAKKDLLPKASTTYSYTRLKDTSIMKQGGSEVPVAYDNQYHWDLSLVQPLFTGFALSSQVKLAKFDFKTSIVTKEQRLIELTRDIRSACYNLLLAEKMCKVATEEVAALTTHKNEAEQYYRQGLIPKNDLLKSEVALSAALQEKERAGATVKNAMALVNILMNATVDREIAIEDIDEALIRQTYEYPLLAAEAKKNRPELVSLHNSLAKADIRKTLAKSAYYPELSMVGQYERNGDSPGMSENIYANEDNASLTLQAKWTFFEWGKTKAEVSKATHEKRALKEALRNAENAVCLEVNSALLNLRVAAKNIKTAKNSLDQAKENWRITKAQYAQQVSTSADVLDARTFLTSADSNYYGALYGYMVSLAELDRAVGKR